MQWFWDFLKENVHVVGWSGLLLLVGRLSWHAGTAFKGFQEDREKSREAAKTIEMVATNHLPHIQKASEEILEEIKGLRRDLIQVLINKK